LRFLPLAVTCTLLMGCPAGSPGGDGEPACDFVDEYGDWIDDRDEGTADLDNDFVLDDDDSDADGDGLYDAEEAGDDDPCTPPIDSDDDGQPDYKDLDSDSDGLSDRDEHERTGTSPTDPDTDGDGYDDGVEAVAGTDPRDPDSRIPPEDFYVVLPYDDPDDPDDDIPPQTPQLAFGTVLELADVFFLVDTSQSMGEAIRNVQDSLEDVILPGLQDAIPDVQIGVGEFEDFPVDPYGWDPDNPLALDCDDRPFTLQQRITADEGTVADALSRLDTPLGCGNDRAESAVEALRQVATGAGIEPWVAESEPCPEDPDGGGPPLGAACFRPGAQPIIVLVSDAPMHNGPGGLDPYVGLPGVANYGDALAALREIGARVVGLLVEDDDLVRSQMEAFALDTGTVDPDNSPLVFDAPAGEAGEQLVDAVTRLVGATPQDISIAIEDHPDDAFDATRFVTDVAPALADPYARTDGTGFLGVPPGGTVWFQLTFANPIVQTQDETRVYRATIRILGNGVALLDTRNVYVVVPTEDGTFLI